jgi:SAM-dependent methyltransferase
VSEALTGPNAEQAAYWARRGESWVELAEVFDILLEPFGRAAINRAAPARGERAIDVGSGNGATTIDLARRVGPEGEVLGVDLSEPMVELARTRLASIGVDAAPARIELGDVQTYPFPNAHYDLAVSRFGTMFFGDPVAAFGNLRRALRASGRFSFVCWQTPERNPWIDVPVRAVREHLDLGPPPEPGAPGPFSLGEADRVRAVLSAAGFEGVVLEPFEQEMRLPADPEAAAARLAEVGGAVHEAMQRAAQGQRAVALAAIRDAIAPYSGPGGVCLAASAWLVLARR